MDPFVALAAKQEEYMLLAKRWHSENSRPTPDKVLLKSLSVIIDSLKTEMDGLHKKMLHPTPPPGDFSWMTDTHLAEMLDDGYKAADAIPGAWTWFRSQDPPPDKGYMFWSDNVSTAVAKRMQIGHSGPSFATTMRHLQEMARVGWDAWVQTQQALKVPL